MENKEVVMRIRVLMETRKETANMFAKSIGFNQSNLSKVLKGDRNVPPRLVTTICEALGLTYSHP